MRVTSKQYAQVLYELSEGKQKADIEKSLKSFVSFLAKNRKLKMAEKIIENFGRIYNKKKGIVEAEVTSRKKMNEADLKKIKHYVKERYDAKDVVLKNTADETIKGGMILKIEDEVIDGSVKGKLQELKKALIS